MLRTGGSNRLMIVANCKRLARAHDHHESGTRTAGRSQTLVRGLWRSSPPFPSDSSASVRLTPAKGQHIQTGAARPPPHDEEQPMSAVIDTPPGPADRTNAPRARYLAPSALRRRGPARRPARLPAPTPPWTAPRSSGSSPASCSTRAERPAGEGDVQLWPCGRARSGARAALRGEGVASIEFDIRTCAASCAAPTRRARGQEHREHRTGRTACTRPAPRRLSRRRAPPRTGRHACAERPAPSVRTPP